MRQWGKQNVFWPSSYTTQRINEEMSLALRDMDKINFKMEIDKYGNYTYKYFSKSSNGHVIEILYYGGDYKNGTLKSIFPAYFEKK